MGFLQDAAAIAKRTGANTISLRDLEHLKEKYDMDPDTFRSLRRKSRRGKIAVHDINQYFEEFSAPLFTKRQRRLVHSP